MPLQSHAARKARSVLPGELHPQGQEQQQVREGGRLPAVRKQLKNYERMKLLMERWIDLATELSTLRLIKKSD